MRQLSDLDRIAKASFRNIIFFPPLPKFDFFKKTQQRFSHSRYYFLLISLVVFSLGLFSIGICWMLYQNINDQAQDRVQNEGERIAKELNDIFHETHKLMTNIGKTIATSQPDDFLTLWQQVMETFGGKEREKKTYIWPDLGWVSTDNKQVFNTKNGLISFPVDMSVRNYAQLGREYPWTLQFAAPGPNIPPEASGAWVLPIGMGVTNENDEFMGIVGAAFLIPDLISTINEVARDHSVAFVLLNNEGRPILQSLGKKIEDNETALVELQHLGNLNSSIDKIPAQSIAFHYTKQMSGTPYTLVTYLDNVAIINHYYQVFIPHVTKFLAGGIFYLLLAFFFLNNLIRKNSELADAKRELEDAIKLAKSSDTAKEEFLKRVRQELMTPYVNIVTYTEILVKHLKGDIDLELTSEKQLQFLERIRLSCIDLKTLTTNVLDLAYKDMKPILEECLKIQAKEAFMKAVVIESDIPTLPSLLIDELRFKQIIVGLLSRAISFTQKGGVVFLAASVALKDEVSVLKIVIKDTGIGLAEDEWQRMASQHNIGAGVSRYTDGTDLQLSAIERLIGMLNGTYTIDNVWRHGNKVTLFFPYYSEEEWKNQVQKLALDKSSVFLCDWSYAP